MSHSLLSDDRWMQTMIAVTFSEHVPIQQVLSMVSSIAAYGNVCPGSTDHIFTVQVFRASKLPKLKAQLSAWEQNGFLNWSERNSN